MAKSFKIGIQFTESSQAKLNRMRNPAAWQAYRDQMLRLVTEGVKRSIQTTAAKMWKKPKGILDNAWFVRLSQNRATIYNSKHYAYYLNFGVHRHQMTYLLHSPVRTYLAWGRYPYQAHPAIPIETDGGLIFRRPTAEAMAAGKWMHPGFPPYAFMEKGIDAYKTNEMPSQLSGLQVEIFGK